MFGGVELDVDLEHPRAVLLADVDADHVVLDLDVFAHDRQQLVLQERQVVGSVAAGPLVNGPNTARLVTLFKAPLDHDRALAISGQLFGVIDRHLATRDYLAADHATIADLAIYSYTAHAPEGGVSLEAFPHLKRWLKRVEALPGFVPMRASPRLAA